LEKSQLKDIEFRESYILGWEVVDTKLILYLEFLLTDSHEAFTAFDPLLYYGCYKIGLIEFHEIRDLRGLKSQTQLPVWNEQLSEYIDLFEIESFELKESTMIIESDKSEINCRFNKFRVTILDLNKYS
jgi:hypothetical protein